MPEAVPLDAPYLELLSPDGSTTRVVLGQSPFLIGRGSDGNHLPLDDRRISRQCVALISQAGQWTIEDRGHRLGVFVNGTQVTRSKLRDGDAVSFGLPDSYRLVMHLPGTGAAPEAAPYTAPDAASASLQEAASSDLSKLGLLLEATNLLHSQMPLEAVLHSMLDRAISITNADRCLLFEAEPQPEAETGLRAWLARGRGRSNVPPEEVAPSQTAVNMAMQQKRAVITEDAQRSQGVFDSAQSIIAQRLRAVVAIPLYAMPRANTEASLLSAQVGELLGLLYLDSQRPAAFSKLDRQILDAIAIESASILDNARLVKREIERQRYEQELNIAREIQQALLPRKVQSCDYLAVLGHNVPCHEVGGDYFDVFPLDSGRTAFLISDVAGKGLGAALLTTMLQGALSGLSLGTEPARVFHHINSFLCEHAEVGRYATMFFAAVDGQGNVEFLNAGHLPPLLVRQGEVQPLFVEGSLPIGLVPEAEYIAERATLQPGDTLVLFSDGVTEAADERDELFGLPRLEEALAGAPGASLEQMQQRVLDAVERFSGEAEPADDLTLLLVRYLGPPPA